MNTKTKVWLSVLAISLILLYLYKAVVATFEKSTKSAMVVSVPTYEQMTPEEKEMQDRLFSGDTLVRVELLSQPGLLNAVKTKSKTVSLATGNVVKISNFANGSMYLIF